jgi:hypothetical protein
MAPIDNRTRNAYAASDIVLKAREENMKRIAIYGTPPSSIHVVIHHAARKRENQPFPAHETESNERY